MRKLHVLHTAGVAGRGTGRRTSRSTFMHKDPAEMIRYFGPEKVRKIHFRNVSAPPPNFLETFMDNGYYDMNQIMKALQEIRFDGIVILDHTPDVLVVTTPSRHTVSLT